MQKITYKTPEGAIVASEKGYRVLKKLEGGFVVIANDDAPGFQRVQLIHAESGIMLKAGSSKKWILESLEQDLGGHSLKEAAEAVRRNAVYGPALKAMKGA